MQKTTKLLNNLINIFMASALAIIVILLFTNVVLRYVFDSGIIWSQELSRYLFVWLVFLGAIVAFKDNEHLSVNMFVKRLPSGIKKIAILINYLIMLWILYIILDGSWEMTALNFGSKSPATGLPLSAIYVMGILVGISIGLIILINLYRLLTNKVKADELIPRENSDNDL